MSVARPTRVTGPRKVRLDTRPEEAVGRLVTVREHLEADVLGSEEQFHRLADRMAESRVRHLQQNGPAADGAVQGGHHDALQLVHRPDEVRHESRSRPAVDLGRGAELLDAARGHDGNPVGDRQGLLLIVSHIERRYAELELYPPDLLAKLHANLRVEGRERLVEEQHARLDGDRPGEGHPLLLAARELAGIPAHRRAEPDELEELAGPFGPRLVALLADAETELDVLLRGHVREQAVGLEDHAHVALVGWLTEHVLAVDEHFARSRATRSRR